MNGGFSYEEAADRCCPFLSGDLIMEILQRLPVKSLLRFESVSKAWQLLILSPQFIAKHSIHQKKKKADDVNYLHCYHHVPHCRNDISTRCPADHHKIGISLISKRNNHNSLFSTRVLPLFDYDVQELYIVGSSNGLVCIRFSKRRGDSIHSFGIWNPATRRFLFLPNPELVFVYGKSHVGFSYVPSTGCYKLVIILVFSIMAEKYVTRVQMLNVGHNRWREGQVEYSHEQPFYNMYDSPVVVNGCLYWFGSPTIGGDEKSSRSMVWFDMEKEVFFRQTKVSYPFDDGFNFSNTRCKLDIFEENLVMFVSPVDPDDSDDELIYDEEDERNALQVCCQVWIYEEANRTWKKFFTFGPLPSGHLPPRGFWGNREIIIRRNEMVSDYSITLQVTHAYGGLHPYLYNTDSKERTTSFCRERNCNLAFYPYVESLVQI